MIQGMATKQRSVTASAAERGRNEIREAVYLALAGDQLDPVERRRVLHEGWEQPHVERIVVLVAAQRNDLALAKLKIDKLTEELRRTEADRKEKAQLVYDTAATIKTVQAERDALFTIASRLAGVR